MNRILIKVVIILSVISLAPFLHSFAQAQSNTQEARKLDEFPDVMYSDLIARLDNLAIQLQQEPNTRGFIIIYRSRRDLPGLTGRLGNRIKQYMVYSRGIDAERVVIVDGGVAASFVQELWIVPVGATPKPRDDVYSGQLIDTESAWKFDEYYYPMPRDFTEGYVGSSLEAFVEVLRKYPNSQAYILAYPQYYRRGGNFDPPNTFLKMQKALKADLTKKYGVAPSRIKVVNGGYRKQRQIELWVVPRGEHAPIATPNTFPNRRR